MESIIVELREHGIKEEDIETIIEKVKNRISEKNIDTELEKLGYSKVFTNDYDDYTLDDDEY